MKIIRSITLIVLLFALTLTAPLACAADDGERKAPPELSSRACIIMDMDSRETIFAQSEKTPLYCGDLSAMVTALVAVDAVERGELSYDDTVTAIAADYYNVYEASPGFEPGIMLGEELTLEELLYCSLAGQSREASNLIARLVAGSVSDFVVLMNEKAQELGCVSSCFSNANGVDEDGQFSCAKDMAVIACEIMAHRKLMDICTTVYTELEATNVAPARVIRNSNYLIRPDRTRYYYPEAIGLKSGYSEHASYCVASAIRYEGHYIIFVMLGAPLAEAENGYYDMQSFVQTKKLMQWFADSYKAVSIVDSVTPLAELDVSLGEGADTVVVRADSNSSVFVSKDSDTGSLFTRRITFYDSVDGEPPVLTAPVANAQAVGEMYVDGLGRTYGPYILVTNTDVPLSNSALISEKISAFFRKPWLKLIFLGLVFLVIVYIAVIIQINKRRAKRRRKLRESGGHSKAPEPRKKQ